jgi:competence protein ComEC
VTGRDARLAPAAAGAWIAAALAIGVPEAAGWASVVAWVAAACAVAASFRMPWAAVPALVLIAAGLVLTAVPAGLGGREPAHLRDAAEHSRSVDLEVVVDGRVRDGRVRVLSDGAPLLLFGAPRDDVVSAARIGEMLLVTGVPQRAEPGDEVAFLLFAHAPAVPIAEPPGALRIAAELRERFAAVAATLPGPGAGLLPGLTIGDTSAVPAALDADMKAASLSHLTAVSGSNCAVVVVLVTLIAAALGLGRIARLAAALVALGGFVLLVTPEPSVVRAAVMAGVALLAFASSRPAAGIPVLCLTDPWLARSYGFALSVLATAGLLVLARPIAERLGALLPRWLALLLAVPLSAQLACQPVLLLLDPSLPLYGVPANALAEPAAPIATVVGLVGCLLAPVAPPLAFAAAWVAWLPSTWIAAVATWTASLPGARSPWPTGAVGVVLLIVLTAVALALILGIGPRRLRRGAARLLVVAAIAYALTLAGGRIVTELTRPADWQYALCDVGQGDALLVRDAGAVALIDTGPDPEPLAACLDGLGVARIDLLVLTHYDLDHVGGVDAVIGRVGRALIGPASDAADEAIAGALRAGGARVDQVAAGERGALGRLDWRVVWPPPTGVEPGNPASVTLLIEPGAACPCLSALALGDLGEESQLRLRGALRQQGGVPRVDVVKVAHHGSADQAAALYEELGATVGLIGVGADNDYGHPTASLLSILAAAGTMPERSDVAGLVLVAPGPDPGSVRVWTERGADVGSGP